MDTMKCLGSTLDKEGIGRRLKQARELAILSRQEVAKLLGYKSSTAIANKESGLAYPSLVDLHFLSFRSGLSIDWIVTGYTHTSAGNSDWSASVEVLSANEAELIRQYRSLNDQQKARLAFLLMRVKDDPSHFQLY
jgi:transcriptional regulator with XRE-family HTH domain